MKKILFIILDGLADRPVKALGYKTALEAAKTKNMDCLAKEGVCGLLEPVFKEKFPTSKEGHLTLFGYSLEKPVASRGVFEVLGMGERLEKEDIAFRGNFATVNNDLIIINRRAGRISETGPLIKSLQGITLQGIKFFVFQGISHRLGLVMRGRGLSDKISEGDFHQVDVKAPSIRPLDETRGAKFSSQVLNQFLLGSHQILKAHNFNKKRQRQGLLPANYILLREPGKLIGMPKFEKKWGLKACCIAGGTLYKGIGLGLAMDLIKVKGATAKADSDFEAKVKAAVLSLKKYDFCFLHIKAIDNLSHDKDCLGKKKIIERIDECLSPVFSLKNTLVVITGDHATPCQKGEHSADLIPVLVWGNGADQVKSFSEKACSEGGLGKTKSIDFLKKVVKM